MDMEQDQYFDQDPHTYPRMHASPMHVHIGHDHAYESAGMNAVPICIPIRLLIRIPAHHDQDPDHVGLTCICFGKNETATRAQFSAIRAQFSANERNFFFCSIWILKNPDHY